MSADSDASSDAGLDEELEARMREVARDEAQSVYDDLTAVTDDGESYSLGDIQHRINSVAPELSRRDVLKSSVIAFGYVATGAGLGAAIMRALSSPAAAGASGEYGTSSNPLNYVRTENLVVQSATFDTDWYSEVIGGTVASGDAGPVWATTLDDTETLKVTQGALVNADLSAAPSGADLIIADIDNGVSETTLITGDGTVKDDETGSPLGSYQNSSGSSEQVAILMDNGYYNSGSGSDQNLIGSFIGRVT